MEEESVIYLNTYSPEGVQYLTTGSSCYIGIVDDTTILKYPRVEGDKQTLDLLNTEAQIYKAVGAHKHILGFKGQRDEGILLERAQSSITEYLRCNFTALQQRLAWVRQAAEAIAAVHAKNVIHRDINVNNFLLDEELNLKLCDFQGHLIGPDGNVEQRGNAIENAKSYMPRADPSHADWKSDIFALGSAIYYIMEGHEPFPELDSFDDEDEIEERFASGRFPEVQYSGMQRITHKCWAGSYDSVHALLEELAAEIRPFTTS
jgi:serine/threonine protein kinase